MRDRYYILNAFGAEGEFYRVKNKLAKVFCEFCWFHPDNLVSWTMTLMDISIWFEKSANKTSLQQNPKSYFSLQFGRFVGRSNCLFWHSSVYIMCVLFSYVKLRSTQLFVTPLGALVQRIMVPWYITCSVLINHHVWKYKLYGDLMQYFVTPPPDSSSPRHHRVGTPGLVIN